MEKTDKFVMRLDAFDKNAFPMRYYDVEDMMYQYEKLNEEDKEINAHLDAIREIITKAKEKKKALVNERFEIWEKLLYDFYYIKVFGNIEKEKVLHEFYFYPYMVLRENSRIFGLYSEKKDSDNFSISDAGIVDTSFDIFTDLSFSMEIEYSSEEEMINNANEMSKKLIDIRLWKLKYRDRKI